MEYSQFHTHLILKGSFPRKVEIKNYPIMLLKRGFFSKPHIYF